MQRSIWRASKVPVNVLFLNFYDKYIGVKCTVFSALHIFEIVFYIYNTLHRKVYIPSKATL